MGLALPDAGSASRRGCDAAAAAAAVASICGQRTEQSGENNGKLMESVITGLPLKWSLSIDCGVPVIVRHVGKRPYAVGLLPWRQLLVESLLLDAVAPEVLDAKYPNISLINFVRFGELQAQADTVSTLYHVSPVPCV